MRIPMGKVKIYDLRGKLLYSYYPTRLAMIIDVIGWSIAWMGIALFAYVLLASAGAL
jgi:hypothetical protein